MSEELKEKMREELISMAEDYLNMIDEDGFELLREGKFNRVDAAQLRLLQLFEEYAKEREIEARGLLENDLQKFEELWSVWGVENGIDFNMDAIEKWLESQKKASA